MSDSRSEIKLGFDEVTTMSELKSRGISVPMVSAKITPELIKIGNASKHSLTSMVKVSDLLIDYSYQRNPNPAKVAKIAKNFNYDALGVIIVSIRESGEMFILDGGHRIAAMNLLGKNAENVNALVYFDLTIEQEAKLFVSLNEERTKPKKIDLHIASSTSGNSDSIAIDNVLSANGLQLGDKPGYGIIRAVGTVQKIHEKIGSEKFGAVLRVLIEANSNHSKHLCAEYLSATATIMMQYKVDFNKLSVAINKLGDPVVAIAKANGLATSSNAFAKTQSLCSMIIDNYNYKLTKNRLDKTIIFTINARNYLSESGE